VCDGLIKTLRRGSS